jgi:Domain of unknown function (DUF4397)
MRNPQMIRIAAGALAIAMMFTTACTPDATTTPVTTPIYAKAQFVHVAPEAPAAIVSVDGKNINTDSLKYLQYINYVDVDVTAAGKRLVKFDAKTGNLTTDSIALNKDVNYSFFAYSDSGKTRTKIASDDLATPTTGKAKLRIGHFISDALVNVDVEAVAPGKVATSRNDFSGLKFKDVTGFIELAAGSYDLKVKSSANGNPLFLIPTVTFEAGKSYTLVARGYVLKAEASGVFIINNK